MHVGLYTYSMCVHMYMSGALPLIVRLTLAWAVNPGTDGTAPTHMYAPALSYEMACIDREPS